jgi:hypothetical protein
MIKIAISEAAFEAIAQTPLRGSVDVEPEANEPGERTIRLNRMVADRLGAMRGPGESIGDVLLRIATEGGAAGSRSLAHGKAVGDTGGRAVWLRSNVKVDDHHLPPSLASCGYRGDHEAIRPPAPRRRPFRHSSRQ